MHAMHYEIALPADRDMRIIRLRPRLTETYARSIATSPYRRRISAPPLHLSDDATELDGRYIDRRAGRTRKRRWCHDDTPNTSRRCKRFA